MAKLVIFAFLAAVLALSSAASLGGIKDLAGNYYDFTTGQLSSAITGRVYNTLPPVAPYAYIPSAAPVVAAAAPYYYGAYPYTYGAAYIAPAWK